MKYEKLGLFYLGRHVDPDTHTTGDVPLLYDSSDLVTHAVILGMTGSGKTGLGIDIIEEAAIDGVPVIAVDPKGDLSNLLLTFPDLSAEEFAPWVSHEDARAAGTEPAAFAEAEAARWKAGLADWAQDGARIARFRKAADVAVYTPGSTVGRPLSIMASFAAPPPAVAGDAELLAERVSTAATSVLTLAGVDAEPLRSREHILVATLLEGAWRAGHSLDLPALIGQIQQPPVTRVGVLDMDSFFPAQDRFGLAMRLNNLLAAPGFETWMTGDPLDVDTLLFTDTGTPRVSIVSIAHLDDTERMFFVSLLLNEIVGWMRGQQGTSSLRAIVYFDEIAGFLPPVANPPSKAPLLVLLKQARAFGLGMTLATQNPVDLDYKALSNAGTWMLGRLQTDRDKARVLDGLEGVSATSGAGFDRRRLDTLLSGLQKRVFLLHNVHEQEPALFQTRWTLSYLRGPLSREELGRLTADSTRAGEPAAGASTSASTPGTTGTATAPADASSTPAVARADVAPAAARAPAASGVTSTAAPAPPASTLVPVVDPAVPQYFAPGAGDTWTPALVGAARITYSNSKLDVDTTRDIAVTTNVMDRPVPVDWEEAEPAAFDVAALTKTPAGGSATFAPLPSAAGQPKRYARWTKDFERWAARTAAIEVLTHKATGLVSAVDEAERDFRIRVQQAAREARDAAVAKVREKYAKKVARLEDRLSRARQATARQAEQASDSKRQVGVSMAATVLGALFGRKSFSLSTLGRATTAARGVSRASREAADVDEARAKEAALDAEREALTAEIEAAVAAAGAEWDQTLEAIERVTIKPKRGGVDVRLVALVWVRS